MLGLKGLKVLFINHVVHSIVNQRLFSFSRKFSAAQSEVKNMSFIEEKQKFLEMSSEEKRKVFLGQVVSLNQIPTWTEFWNKNKSDVKVTAENVEAIDSELTNKVSLWQGDITSLEVDAIVNAANSSLLGGGGVDGAIHRSAGQNLKKECATLGGCKVGEAKITGAYKMPSKYVIHTVGPRGEKPDKLQECYESCLSLVKENNLRSVAFPCISTGVYGYPQAPAARVALTTVKHFLVANKNSVDRVIFCVFLESDKDIYTDFLHNFSGLH